MNPVGGPQRSLDVASVSSKTLAEVRKTADELLDDLERRLYAVYKRGSAKLPPPPDPNNNFGDPEDLLKFELHFERIQSDFAQVPIPWIPASQQSDKAIQVDLGEPALRRPSVLETTEDFCQTSEFAYLTKRKGHQVFSTYYPEQPKVLAPRAEPVAPGPGAPPGPPPETPAPPASQPHLFRTTSQEPPLTRGRQLRNLLLPKPNPPTPKSQTYWTGSSFEGNFDQKSNFERGKYTYPSGPIYIGDFRDGKLHSENVPAKLTYPRGDTFKGNWTNGRVSGDGKITFYDGLEFQPFDWTYLNGTDRRFHVEATGRAATLGGFGEEALGNSLVGPPRKIPVGHYNVGDGLYNAAERSLTTYDCKFLRKATDYEHHWIIQNCAQQLPKTKEFKPKFADFRPPDVYARP